jgi:CubicO group peptidase (beta-lactamase class C family)
MRLSTWRAIMKTIVRGLIVLFLIVPFGAAYGQEAGQAASPESPAAQTDKFFDFWNRLDQPGFGALVIKDGQVAYQKLFGLACQEHLVPLTPNSLFNTATLAQPFVGQAVAMLEAQGKLSAEDDVRKYIPELPDLGTPVKLRHLLYHTSGLRDWLPVLQIRGRDQVEITMADVLGVLKAQKALLFTPGERVEYTNTDYDLLAEVVKRATGKPFPDWAFENILKPLKMTRTVFRDNYRAVLDDAAFSYDFTRSQYLKAIDTLSLVGSHSLFTSVSELSKWLLDLGAGKVCGPAVREKMFTPGKLNDGRSTGYGYGLGIGESAGRRSASLYGEWANSSTDFVYLPDQGVACVVFANWDYTSIQGFAAAGLDTWLPPLPRPAPPAAAPAKPKAAARKVFKVKPTVLDSYRGDYRLGPGQVFSINRNGDKLQLGVPGQMLDLTALSETEFKLDLFDARLAFQKDKNGKVTGFIWKQGGQEAQAPRVVIVNPTPRELEDYAGTYVNEELGVTFTAEVRGPALFLIPGDRPATRLIPDEKDRFNSAVAWMPVLIFQRNAEGRVTGFVIDSGAVRDLVFKKG